MDDFNFAIARITTVQLCRACGFDRFSRVALNSFSDIFVRYLKLLASAAASASAEAGKEECDIVDVLLALQECSVSRKRIYEEDAGDIEEFLAWLRGPAPQRALQATRPHRQALSALGSVLPASGTNSILGSLGMELPEPTADWLKTIVNQQKLMGHAHKFKNTELDSTPSNGTPIDNIIAGGPSSIKEFYEETSRNHSVDREGELQISDRIETTTEV